MGGGGVVLGGMDGLGRGGEGEEEKAVVRDEEGRMKMGCDGGFCVGMRGFEGARP